MANVLYDLAKQRLLEGALSWTNDDIRVALMRSTYMFNSAHAYMSDISAYVNGRSGALTSKSATNGTARAANVSLSCTANAACNAIVIYRYNASDSAALLIAYIDTFVESGLAWTPVAQQIMVVHWYDGPNGIFTL